MSDPFRDLGNLDPDAGPELTPMQAIAWSLRKAEIMRDGRTADQAEVIIRREMEDRPPGHRGRE